MFKWFKNILYAIPFGLKAADSEIMSSKNTGVNEGSTIEKEVNENTLMNSLIKGEITEEVEEFRYSTYEIGAKANEYEYVGNGKAIKKEIKNKEGKIHFIQPNKPVVSTVLDDLKHVNDYGDLEQYFINVEYKEFSRFRINTFITEVEVIIRDEIARTKIYFSVLPDPYNAVSAPFINELKKIAVAKDSEYALNRNEIANKISTLSFITFKASNDEPDLISYAFHTPKFIDYKENKTSAYIEYEWGGYIRENLRDKFYSKSKDEKYKTKAKKENSSYEAFINPNDVIEPFDPEMLKKIQDEWKEFSNKRNIKTIVVDDTSSN